jgi:hypothetical protein
METSSEIIRDFALIRCLAFRRFCGVDWMRRGIMGHGGGRAEGVEEIGEC